MVEPKILSFEELYRETQHVKELFEQRFIEHEKALKLNAAEILRRLIELNHAHEQARDDFSKYVSYDTFRGFETAWNKWREDFIRELEVYRSTIRKEQEIYRETVRKEIATLNDRSSSDRERRKGGELALGRLGAIIFGVAATVAAITAVLVTLLAKIK